MQGWFFRSTTRVAAATGICLAVVVWLVFTDKASSAVERGVPPADAPPAEIVTDAQSALRQTAALVEATLIHKTTEFSESTGPWTRYEFEKVIVHRGSIGDKPTLVFYQEGGFYPDGRRLVVSSVPELVEGESYVLFLRNTSWRTTPIVGDLAFRIVTEEDRQFLVDTHERPIRAFSEHGVHLAPPAFSRPDLNGKEGRARLLGVELPEQALSVSTLVD